jgi:hypothetical protein
MKPNFNPDKFKAFPTNNNTGPKFDLTVYAPKIKPIDSMPGATNWGQIQPNKFFPNGVVPPQQNMLGKEIMQKQAQMGVNLLKSFKEHHKTIQSDDISVLTFDSIKEQNPKEKDPRFKAVVGTILKINDDTRYTDNSISNKTKVISMTNCGLEDYDVYRFCEIFSYSLDLDYVSFANNSIKTGSKILREYHHANLYKNGVNCSIKHLNLSNNQIEDINASIIATHIKNGEVPNLQSLDIHGNNLTKKGFDQFKVALESNATQDIVITMANVNTMMAAVSFFSSWFDAKIIEYKQNSAEAPWNTKAFATDQGTVTHCQQALGLTSGGIALGVVKQSAKKVSPLKLFYAVLRDGGPDEILNSEWLGCIKDMNEMYNPSQTGDDYGKLLGEESSHCEIF